VWGLALPLLAAPALAQAAQPADCPTWFPDFQCDRHGRHEGFSAPVSAPYLFEDPFITTGASAYALWHQFPKSSALQGGHVNVLAVQLRAAITDRLGFIATQDGVAFFDPDNPLLERRTGLMDFTAGFKYALVDRPDQGVIVSPSLRFRVPMGSRNVFQNNGDGIFIPGLSAGWKAGDLHWLGNVGAELPIDGGANSTMIFWNMHLDYNILGFVSPFAELNAYHYVNNGDGKYKIHTNALGNVPLSAVQTVFNTGPFEGLDYSNLGSDNVTGNNIFTLAVGARVPIGKHVSIGAAYEFPIFENEDVTKQRVTTNLLVEF
jgi:hypothetical protein